MFKRIPAFSAVFIALFVILAGAAPAASNTGETSPKQLAKEMGVPVYPESKYLESMGAYSQPGQKMYVFESMDKPEKAADWYKKKLKKPIETHKRGTDTVFVIHFNKVAPDDYIMFEPNSYGGKGLSIITVIKKVKK